MSTTARIASFIGAVLVSTLVLADGVPLFSPAETLAGVNERRLNYLATQDPSVGTLTPIKVNLHAIDSNIITVQLDGKDYRFAMFERVPPQPELNNGVWELGAEHWRGRLGSPRSFVLDGRLVTEMPPHLSVYRLESYVGARIDMGAQVYWLEPGVLIKERNGVPLVGGHSTLVTPPRPGEILGAR